MLEHFPLPVRNLKRKGEKKIAISGGSWVLVGRPLQTDSGKVNSRTQNEHIELSPSERNPSDRFPLESVCDSQPTQFSRLVAGSGTGRQEGRLH